MNSGPDLQTLLSLFPPTDYLQSWKVIPADQVPEPYHKLLVHEHHMTVTVEAHHGSLVDVRILERRQDGASYARKILLALQSSGKIVQFGIVRIRLELCSAAVRAAILAGQTPLGRILIEHDVLRRIEPTAFLQIIPGAEMMRWFGAGDVGRISKPSAQAGRIGNPSYEITTYGRLALIHCDGQPAIELLEIVAPEPR